MPNLLLPGYIYQSPSGTDPASSSPYWPFTASCSGSIIDVTIASALPIYPGQIISGTGVAVNTLVLWQISGVIGGIGYYQLSTIPGTIASETMYNTLGSNASLANGAGNIWYQTDTGNYFLRNPGGTAWVALGNSDLIGLGMLAQSGGAMNGAITGSTLVTADGLTAIAKPPEVLAQNSTIASMADVQALQTTLLGLIQTLAKQSIGNAPSPGLRANMVFMYGTAPAASAWNVPVNLNTIVTSLGQTYPDGTVVQPADCYGFAVMGVGFSAGHNTLTYALTMQDTKGMIWESYQIYNATYYPANFEYIIMAIKPSAQ